MRILIVHPGPDFSVADVYQGWAKSFRELGHDVAVYNTNDRLSFYGQVEIRDYKKDLQECGHPVYKRAMDDEQAMAAAMQGLSHACYTFWPNLVFFVSAFFTTAPHLQLIRSRQAGDTHKIVMLHTESPYQDEEQLMRGQFADLNLLNDPVNIDKYEALDIPAYYMPHAYDPEIHYRRKKPLDSDYQSDFCFVGTSFKSRVEFFEHMYDYSGGFDGIDTVLGGSGWQYYPESPLLNFVGHDPNMCVPNSETAEVYRNGKVGINFYRREGEAVHQGEGWAIGPREVEMAACGLPFLRDSRPESDEVFGNLPSFSSPEEAVIKLRWLLNHEKDRERLAREAYTAIKDRTFLNNASWLLKTLDQQGICKKT